MMRPASEYYRAVLPEDARPGRIIVYEQTGRWAAALRRSFALPRAGARPRTFQRYQPIEPLPPMEETRVWSDCLESLAKSPGSFVLVELNASSAAVLPGRIVDLARQYPAARFAVAAARNLAEYEPLVRETGAVLFVVRLSQAADVAEAARRHLDGVSGPRPPLAAQVWAMLPWGR